MLHALRFCKLRAHWWTRTPQLRKSPAFLQTLILTDALSELAVRLYSQFLPVRFRSVADLGRIQWSTSWYVTFHSDPDKGFTRHQAVPMRP